MMGYQFRRQRPILDYIVDFMCMDLLLIVEVDDISHDDNDAKHRGPSKRSKNLKKLDLTFCDSILGKCSVKIEDVSEAISSWIEDKNRTQG